MASPVENGTISIGVFRFDPVDPVKTLVDLGQVVTPTDNSRDFDGSHVRLGSVVVRGDGTIYLYYEGITAGPAAAVGVATSTDGRSFRRFAGNPILMPTGQGRNDGTYVSQFAVNADADDDLTAIYSCRSGGTIMPALRVAWPNRRTGRRGGRRGATSSPRSMDCSWRLITTFKDADGLYTSGWKLIYQGSGDHEQPYGTNRWPLGVATFPL